MIVYAIVREKWTVNFEKVNVVESLHLKRKDAEAVLESLIFLEPGIADKYSIQDYYAN